MEENNLLISLDEIKNNETPIVFHLKQTKKLAMFIIVALLIMVVFHNRMALFIGVLILILPLINIFLIKDKIILEMYSDFFVIPDSTDITKGYKIPYENVELYSFEKESYNASVFVVKLSNGNTFAIPSDEYRIFQEFKKRIPEAEKYTKFHKEQEEKRKKRKEKN